MKNDQDFSSGTGPRRSSILLVEDEFLIRMAVADDLRAEGYVVFEAGTGEEARDMLLSGAEVDVVVSDVRMPGKIDGLELLAFVRMNFRSLPVILCSGHLSSGIAQAQGAAAFLSKPYTTGALAEIIQREHAAA